MRLYRGNGVWELPDEELVERFRTSKYGDREQYPWPTLRALLLFIAAPAEDGGLNSTFEGGIDGLEGVRAVLLQG